MKPQQTIYNKRLNTVTIHIDEYNKLLAYKQLCKEFREIMSDGGEGL